MAINIRHYIWTITVSLGVCALIVYHSAGKFGDYELRRRLTLLERRLVAVRQERQSCLKLARINARRYQIADENRRWLSDRLNLVVKRLNQHLCSTDQNVTSTGAWCSQPFQQKHFTDESLAGALSELLQGQTVASFGEGPGDYRRLLMASGTVSKYDAYDGSPWIENATENAVKFLDLTIPHFGIPIYDWVISVEVAEHIPSEFEAIYVSNLVRHARKGLVISWAIPHQSGYAHINPRTPEYVEELFGRFCFAKDLAETNRLRRFSGLIWLKKNISVFKRSSNCSMLFDDD